MLQTKAERLVEVSGLRDVGATTTPLGTYSLFPGVQVTVSQGDAADFLAMRAAQLAALTKLFASEGFEQQAEMTKANARWLVTTLAEEVAHLIPIALKEAAQD